MTTLPAHSRLMSIFRAMRRMTLAIAAIVSVLLPATPANAQFGLMGMGSEMNKLAHPATDARMLHEYARILGLSDQQKRAADELLYSYQAGFRDAVSRLEDIVNSISEEQQESGDFGEFQGAMMSTVAKFMAKSDELHAAFMNDLKTLLEPSQLERFPTVERYTRRKSSLKMGAEGLQRLDLIDEVDGLHLEPAATTGLAGTLEQYAVDFDRELSAHDKLIRSFVREIAKISEDGKGPEENPEIFTKWFTDLNDSLKRIEAVNSKYIPTVRAALPEPAQREFDARIKLARYPFIYKRTYTVRVFDAVDKMTDLDAPQKEGLKSIKETYTRDSGDANDKWAAVVDELRGQQSGAEAMMGGGMWMIRNNEKYTAARDARKAIDEKALDAVKALLNESQRAKLPKKNYRPEWDFDQPKDGSNEDR